MFCVTLCVCAYLSTFVDFFIFKQPDTDCLNDSIQRLRLIKNTMLSQRKLGSYDGFSCSLSLAGESKEVAITRHEVAALACLKLKNVFSVDILCDNIVYSIKQPSYSIIGLSSQTFYENIVQCVKSPICITRVCSWFGTLLWLDTA